MAPLDPIVFENISDNETVHQRCILITGQCLFSSSDEDVLSITSNDQAQNSTFPVQNWPINAKHFKALVILSPGDNFLTFVHLRNGVPATAVNLRLSYVPLLQVPPLHLAIMIAKDSPLIIDCPPRKRSAISSAHADLDAAISKLRMTAYMWQALTAEDLRAKGLGRRSFRLEEEWATDTLSRDFILAAHEAGVTQMRSTAKVHLIRSVKTIAELRNANLAQQNSKAKDDQGLFRIFEAALKAHGGPFVSQARPVVAGLILDSAYSIEQNLILGHAALGCHKPDGLSLGMFGSHLTYSWPRFVEEIPACLLDVAAPGDAVGNDAGECGSMWQACSVGQGAFLHEVGHAFGAPHTTGIMARGYSRDWPKNFLSRTAASISQPAPGVLVTKDTPNEATWDLSDALKFRARPHFRLPGDPVLTKEQISGAPDVSIHHEENEIDSLKLVINSPTQIIRLQWNDETATEPSIAAPQAKVSFAIKDLRARFPGPRALKLEVLGMNGASRVIPNVWTLLSRLSFLQIPGTNIILKRKCFLSPCGEQRFDGTRRTWDWAVLLKEKGYHGKLSRACTIDSRVGCILDGAVVYFEDGHKTPCGPRRNRYGHQHNFGGHASQKIRIKQDVDITKVTVGYDEGDSLNGLRFHLSDGTSGGYLHNGTTHELLPSPNERIIGFYGRSDFTGAFHGIEEFGIITAPKDIELPDSIYDMLELQNLDGGSGMTLDWEKEKEAKGCRDKGNDEGSQAKSGTEDESEQEGSQDDDENDDW